MNPDQIGSKSAFIRVYLWLPAFLFSPRLRVSVPQPIRFFAACEDSDAAFNSVWASTAVFRGFVTAPHVNAVPEHGATSPRAAARHRNDLRCSSQPFAVLTYRRHHGVVRLRCGVVTTTVCRMEQRPLLGCGYAALGVHESSTDSVFDHE